MQEASQPLKQRRRSHGVRTRLEELRAAAREAIERGMVYPSGLKDAALAAEAERVRALYVPLFVDLLDRVDHAQSEEELDEVVQRFGDRSSLLAGEFAHLREREG